MPLKTMWKLFQTVYAWNTIQTLSHGPDVSDMILLFSVHSKSPEYSQSEGYHM